MTRILSDRRLVAVVALALALRVAVVAATPGYVPQQDAADYDRIARSIAAGDGYAPTTYAQPGTPSALRPPGWPVTLGTIYAVTGGSWTAARLFEAALGAATVLLVFLVGRELRGRRAGLLAAGAAAVFPPLVFSSAALLTEPLFAPLVLLAVLAVLVLRRRPATMRWALGIGVLGGLAALTRPTGLPLVFVLALATAAAARRPAMAAAVLAASALTVAPWTIRSSTQLDAFVPISTQDGISAYGTYSPIPASRNATWYVPVWLPEVVPLLPRMNEAELDSLLFRRVVRYAAEHPAYPLKALGLNSLRIMGVGPQHAAIAENGYAEMSLDGWWVEVGKWSARVLAVLVFAAAVVLLRAGSRRPPLVLWLAPLLMWVSAMSINAVPRFRTPIDPFLILLVAAAQGAGERGHASRSCRSPGAE